MRTLVLFLLVSFTTFVCAQEDTLEHIDLQLKWKHQFQFAGYYMAKEKGYYQDAGLDVDFFEYEYGLDIVKSVEDSSGGIPVYGIGSSSIVLEKAQGEGIVLLNALNQRSPHMLLSLERSDINSLKDFKNKNIMISQQTKETASILAMLHSQGIEIDEMHQQTPSFDINDLIRHKTDIITAYISNEPYQLAKKGVAFKIWDPALYGFDFYDDILFTSQKEVENYPQRVKAFQEASLKGWYYAYNHIDEAIDLILKKYNTQHKTRAALEYEAKSLKKLAFLGENELGDIQEDKIKRILDVYSLLGMIPPGIDVNRFIFKGDNHYSINATEQAYIEKKRAIKVCIDPNWMPYEGYVDGHYIGMSADFLSLLEQKIHLKPEIVKTKSWQESLAFAKKRKCDILSLAVATKDRKEFLRFTTPYIETSIVIATRNSDMFIDNFSELAGKKLAVTHGYAFKEMLLQRYPKLHFVEVNNLEDGLHKVQKGEVYGYIGALMSVSYAIQKEFSDSLKISGKYDENIALGIGVRDDDPILFSIIQKGIASIDTHQKQRLFNDWISVTYVKGRDYFFLLKFFIFGVMIIGVVWLVYRREKMLKEQLEAKNIVFETIINTIENPLFYKDIRGVYQSVNNAFSKQILGVEASYLKGKTLYDLEKFISKNEIAFFTQQDRKLYESGKDQEYETQLRVKDGEIKYFRIQKNLIYAKDNSVIGYVGFMYDITEIKEREKELERIASIDHMTQLYNRRYFSQVGENIFALIQREKSNISVIMLDIDNFKKVNDTYGHKVGDDVIVAIARILKEICRKSDVACRFGGEEFVLLLPDTDINGAQVIAEKICKNVAALEIKTVQGVLHISVSIGVAVAKYDNSLEQVIQHADKALYSAKENGKNRVELFKALNNH